MKRRELLKGLTMVAGGVLQGAGLPSTAEAQDTPAATPPLATPIRGLLRRNGKLMQPIEISFAHAGAAAEAVTTLDGVELDRRMAQSGSNRYTIYAEPVISAREAALQMEVTGAQPLRASVALKPVRRMQIYLLPHSHHDLGYTDLQAAVEEKQMENISKGIALARKTASYPEGSRFVWNLEVLWGADLFMQRRSPAEKAELVEAVRKGWIALNGSYANELTGLCRPEELLELFRYGTELGKQCGVRVDSAMMSDVPGFSWGTSSAMAQAGIRYFSAAPNYFDRIGDFMVAWQDKPFWWLSPSGEEKVLVWVPWTGYAMSHVMKLGSEWVGSYQQRMDDVNFPYDISYARWSGHGDNAEPDPELSEFVRSWNEHYEWPRFLISSTSTAFAAFEQRYGAQLPMYKGDLTPYWEDGAGSSARETSMSRCAADRITQAATLATMTAPASYVTADYRQAWRDVLLFSEHTWGAWCSVSDSESEFTRKQWAYKRDFAVEAEQRSRELLARALPQAEPGATIAIHNTSSWNRSELVLLSKEMSAAGDRVTSHDGRPVPSQRLSTGELAVLVSEVPAFGSSVYTLAAGAAARPERTVTVRGGVLEHSGLRAEVDERTGDLVSLKLHGSSHDLVNRDGDGAANRYLFLQGTDLAHLGRSGPAKLTVEDHGPLVATLRIDATAPGCNSLTRRVRLTAGLDYVELTNVVDKQRAALNPHPGEGWPGGEFAQRGSKESVQFLFPFAVPGGEMTVDLPLAVMEPERNQLPGSCKNWLPVGRWIDVSNQTEGVTWATLDAPLVELGAITATMLGSQKTPDVWRKHIEPTQTVYSWVMNNHWGTNYLAHQEGPVVFRYAIRPHRGSGSAEASRFATGLSQPLLASFAVAASRPATPLLRIEPAEVIALGVQPSTDGKAWIVRLYDASREAHRATLHWAGEGEHEMWISNLAEEPVERVAGEVPVRALEVVTLRVARGVKS